ncbi:globin domain-containing protein [Bacillus chungangensis]|uniref:Hemoglobin n=1 Tax=Bacillus chungangensis TaxID=587633 RepID=A0ABT9WPD2_9BACI|nr:globin [Bacillus chungangensis]MDQ0174630.1 hemoglobin [Bacillus chungangensis]
MVEKRMTPYDLIGEEQLSSLVNAFYLRVGKHPDLIPIFPEDLTETARKQKQFLTQFLGGPPLYTEEHGHPMMRARHLAHKITPARAKAWLSCMSEAMDAVQLQGPVRDQFFARLTMTARHMVNTEDLDTGEND